MPIVVAGPLGGVIADRFDRRRVMIGCDLARMDLMTLLVEILAETGLQRALDDEVFGRAYGLALPASLGGIVAGSLLAPLLRALLGGPGALVATGGAVLAYSVLLLRRPAGLRSAAAASAPAVEAAVA